MKENKDNPMNTFLGDVPLPVQCRLGRTAMTVSDIGEINEGQTIPLGMMVGEPMDVIVAGTLLARGEVVVVNDKYGVRLSEIV